MGKCLFFSSKSYGYLTRVGAFDNKLAVYHYTTRLIPWGVGKILDE